MVRLRATVCYFFQVFATVAAAAVLGWLVLAFHDEEHWPLVAVGALAVMASSCLIGFKTKGIDIFWFNHVYRTLAVVLIVVFALFIFLFSESGDKGKVIGEILVFLAATIALFLAARSGRVSERQLQQSRFEKAIEMIAVSLEHVGANRKSMRQAGIVLLDDLPNTFLSDKREEIAAALHALRICLYDINQTRLPEKSTLETEMRAARLPE